MVAMARQRVGALACVGLGGIACFVASMVTLHWLQPGLDPLNEAMSYYVHGSQGWLLTLALISIGIGSAALTLALARQPVATFSRAGSWCLGIWCVGVLLGAIFAADPPGHWDKPPSIGGSIHGFAAMVALIIFPAAAFLWTRALRLDARWSNLSRGLLFLARASVVSLVAFLASLVPVFVRPGPPVLLGLTERILFGIYVLWLVVVAVGLLKLSAQTNHQGTGRA
jgi:hypothetical protein